LSAADVKNAQAAWAKYLGRQVEEEDEIAPGVTISFVLVPPGKFRMGSPPNEVGRNPWDSNFDTEAQHRVTLTEPFYLGKDEVTQAQYAAVPVAGQASNPSQFKGANLPVESVTWYEAAAYAEALTSRSASRLSYRLPTEAEWEYACRGGRSFLQPFGIGDGTSLSSEQANFDGTDPYGGAAKGKYLRQTRPVGSYRQPNALGLEDMHGNVWEWCADWFGPYPAGDATNPIGTLETRVRTIRGGSWYNHPRNCRAAARGSRYPETRFAHLGFRLTRVPPVGGKSGQAPPAR
jgi:formylglycine-generating enzyme required for sulfatase activity